MSSDPEIARQAVNQPKIVEAMLARRAVRKGFNGEPVPTEVVNNIISCGLAAPSSKNAQPWKLHVVEERDVLHAIGEEIMAAKTSRKFVPQDPRTGRPREDLQDTVRESAHVLSHASLGIFIEDKGSFSVSRRAVANATPDRVGAVFGFGLEYIGLGACIQNMWLAAEAHGLKGAFMGDAAIAEESIRERLGMVGDFVGVLAVGYTSEQPHPKSIKEDRVVWH